MFGHDDLSLRWSKKAVMVVAKQNWGLLVFEGGGTIG
jgi:hypothetical protein